MSEYPKPFPIEPYKFRAYQQGRQDYRQLGTRANCPTFTVDYAIYWNEGMTDEAASLPVRYKSAGVTDGHLISIGEIGALVLFLFASMGMILGNQEYRSIYFQISVIFALWAIYLRIGNKR